MARFVRIWDHVAGLAQGPARHALICLVFLAAAAVVPVSSAQSALISGGVYEASAERTCNNSKDCEIVFGNVPDGKTLHLTHVSCWSQFTDTANVVVLSVDGSPRHSFLAPIQVGAANGKKNIAANAEVLKLYTARSNPKVRLVLTSNADIFLECQIAGELKP